VAVRKDAIVGDVEQMDLRTRITHRIGQWPAKWSAINQWQRLGIIGGGAFLALLLVITLTTLMKDEDDWDPAILYADLDPSEAVEVHRYLNEWQIANRMTEDRRAVLVPEAMVRMLRLSLATEGFPRSGRMGYEIFDEASLAMTDVLKKVGFQRILKDELEATLEQLEGVRYARVHLVIPGPSLFTGEQNPITASVTLSLAQNVGLEPEIIDGIRYLIHASVQGLDREDVVVVDAEGNLLSEGPSPFEASNESLGLQLRAEQVLEAEALDLLEGIIGKERARVRANISLDFSPDAAHRTKLNEKIRRIIARKAAVQRISLALTFDETMLTVDSETGNYIESPRSQEEIDSLTSLVKHVVIFQEDQGDQMAVLGMPFDKTAEIFLRDEQLKEFWTDAAIETARLIGLIFAFLVLHFVVVKTSRRLDTEGVPERTESNDAGTEEDSQEDVQKKALLDEYSQELQAAHKMQMALMPVESPLIEGFDIAGNCRPAAHVGGDFFQYFQLDENRWIICLVDVTGHGMEAAIPVVMFAGILKNQIGRADRINQLLEQLNQVMHGSMTGSTLTGRTFVCLTGGEIDTGQKVLRLSNSGCPFPYHYRADTGDVEELEVEGYPLGVRPTNVYQMLEVLLAPGDYVVLCTDGIIEADDTEENLYGFERMQYVIREGCRKGLPAHEMIGYIMDEVDRFTGNAPQDDDRTIVVIKVEG